MRTLRRPSLALLTLSLALAACGDGVSDEESARRAYLGLESAIDKSINLGMAGYNSASSANIAPQATQGGLSGTLTVNGQVDQGTSPNKGMRLTTTFVDYSDDVTELEEDITYDTPDAAALPALVFSLRDIPNGTYSGTLMGKVKMSDGLEGDVTLALTFSGQIQESGAGTGDIQRVPGSTTITGTAVSEYGTYDVSLTR